MYTYYKKEQLEEHMYFAEEIYESYFRHLPNDLTARKIHGIVKAYLKDNNITLEEHYYMTSRGLKRVYPIKIAHEAIRYYLEKREMN